MSSPKKAALSLALLAGFLPITAATAQERPVSIPSDVFGAANQAEFLDSLGPIDGATRVQALLSLKPRDQAGAEAFVRRVSSPASPSYGKYLKPAEFAARFGAEPADYAAVAAWALSHGLTIGTRLAAGTTLAVSGDAATMQRLFSTRLDNFRTRGGKVGFAPVVAPVLPAELAGKVSAVIGLANTRRIPTLAMKADPKALHTKAGAARGELGGFSPADLRSIYGLLPAPVAQVPQTVALFEQGGFRAGDVKVFKNRYKLPDVPVTAKGVNGSGTGDTPGVDVEAVLDVDMVIGTNPNLAGVVVYEDAIDDFPVAVISALAHMADDDTAQTISVSYGFDEAFTDTPTEQTLNKITTELAAQGQTVFASTGDSGAYGNEAPNYNVSFPSTNPFITAVGGTTLLADNGQYLAEEAWNLLGSNYGATGGGVSSVFPIPAWQKPELDLLNGLNGGSDTMRNVPDVAAVGDPLTGVSVYVKKSGGWLVFGGTSVSSPVWAGFSSVMNAARVGAGLAPIGFFNPLLYQLDYESISGGLDVLDGTNGFPHQYPGTPGYTAGFLYDNTTGFGSISVNTYLASMMLTDFTGDGLPDVPRGIKLNAGSTDVKVTWSAAESALGYYVLVQSGSSSAIAGSAVTTGRSVTIGGLQPGSDYQVLVVSENNAGSDPAATVLFSTKK